eukprot:6213173-Pleurochrysis_carterae.AAC.1
MSTFNRSHTGPSSSTFQRCVRASTKLPYREPGPLCEYSVKRSSIRSIQASAAVRRHLLFWSL